MGIYCDGHIYGITWFKYNEDGEETRYEKKYTHILTEEQRQEIYADFLRLIPEQERSPYRFRVYTRAYTTYEPVAEFSYFFTWWPLEVKYLLEYFEKGKILGF